MEKPQIFRSPTAVVVWVVWLLFAVGNWIDLAVQGRDHLSVVAAAVLLLATGVAYVTAQRPRIIADDAGVTVRNPLRDHRIGWAGVAEIDLVDLLRVHCAWGGPPGAAPADREHHKVISAWAVHYSRRRQFAAEAKARRGARRSASAVPVGFGRSYGSAAPPREPVSGAEADAERIVKLLQARATAARAEAVWADSTVETAGPHPAPGTDAVEPTPATQPASGTTAAPAAQAAPGTTTVAAAGWIEPLTSTWSRRALAALLIPALILLVVVLI
ncbi:MAG TPA: PH domain-containing protein [Streptosporangiaceae bacterium]|nr:PH domain-containing protein [Streptosporangiaceae bacterium]